jgi:hypothetical protein
MATSLPSWQQAWTGGQARKEGEYLRQLEPQGGLELIWSYMQDISIMVFGDCFVWISISSPQEDKE